MRKAKRGSNTRQGGHMASSNMRQITANPEGSREERRAAKRMGWCPIHRRWHCTEHR